MKTCNKCKIEKPATPDYFYKDIKLKDGLFNTCRECENKRTQKYQEENKEYFARYRKENREHSAKYRKENPEVYRLANQRRRARVAELPHDLTLEEWNETLEYFDYSCAYCGVPEDNLCQEHVIPVVKGGGYTTDNIIPACRSCNKSKYTANLEEWYVSYEHYDEERLNKILDYIEVMEEI